MIRLDKITNILERLVKYSKIIDPDNFLTDITIDAQKELNSFKNLKLEKYFVVSWEYASGVDEELNIIWKPLRQYFYDDKRLDIVAEKSVREFIPGLSTKKNVRNISLMSCADVSNIFLEEHKV